MSRSRQSKIRRWTAGALLAGAVGIGGAGCVAIPVGGGYAESGVAFPAPGVVIMPPPIVFGPGRSRGHYRGGYGYYNRGRSWRG
jgi:hypothetical protein